MMITLRNLGTILLGLFVALAIAACSKPPEEKAEPVSRPVKLFTVGEVGSAQKLKFPGSVSAVRQSDMAFEVPGRIVEMPVTEGDRVAEGTVLARLDPRDYEAERDRARAEVDAARADFNRYKKAFKADAVTAQELDRARRALGVAEAELRRARKAVEDTVLRAPFTGRVARKLVEDYANVQAKQRVLVLQSDHALEMRVSVPEEDWAKDKAVDSAAEIKNDANITVVLSALPDQPIPASISAFQTNADPVTRTFEVTVQFEPPEGVSISPGMTGHVAYVPPPSQSAGMFVPAEAVIAAADNTPYVWLFDEAAGSVTSRGVKLGPILGDRVEVVSGLDEGDRIAVSGVHTLSDGFPVHAMGK